MSTLNKTKKSLEIITENVLPVSFVGEIYYSPFSSPFGQGLVASNHKGICGVIFFDQLKKGIRELKITWPKAKLIEQRKIDHRVIENYLNNKKTNRKIRLYVTGTDFQLKVWRALLSIPTGKTSTYLEVAQKLGDKKLARAVGKAVGDNRIGYLIPCHRVIKANGEIGGYRWGVKCKRRMLDKEASPAVALKE